MSTEVLDPHCVDGCVYTRDENEYCFRAVDLAEAATIEDQCDVATFSPGSSSTPWAGSTLPSVDQLKQNIEEANALITKNQALIAEETENVATAEEAANTIGSIAADLSSSSVSTTLEATTNMGTTTNSNQGGRRVKRQAATTRQTTGSTMTPISDCAEFDTAFNNLLDLVAAVTADNMAAIQALSNVLSAADVNALCTEAAKAALATATSAKIETAQSTVESYKAEVEATLVQLKTEVNKAVAAVAAANTILQTQYNEATIPQAPASTFDVPTTLDIESTAARTTSEFSTNDDTTVARTTKDDTTAARTTNDDTTAARTTNDDTTAARTTNDDTTAAMTTNDDTTVARTTKDDTTEAMTTNEDTTAAATTNDDTTSALTTNDYTTAKTITTGPPETTIAGEIMTTRVSKRNRLFNFRSFSVGQNKIFCHTIADSS